MLRKSSPFCEDKQIFESFTSSMNVYLASSTSIPLSPLRHIDFEYSDYRFLLGVAR